MSEPWLSILGLGENGLDGLTETSRKLLNSAEAIFGGPRHLSLVGAGARGHEWPIPFSIAPVLALRGQKVVILASGDPFWFGAGGSIASHLDPHEWVSIPTPSTFSLAANTQGWKLEETLCFGLHAAPFERLTPVLGRGVRAICTVRDGDAPTKLAAFLTETGFGASELTVMECLGGPRQRVRHTTAQDFALQDIQAPVAVAVDCAGSKGMPRASGLPDSMFLSDGQMTKRPVRALTLSALAPRYGEHLWDIGGGSGSIALEWCLAAPNATATSYEPKDTRCANIRQNAERFGLSHRLQTVHGAAPAILQGQAKPDAIFIGGGNSATLLTELWQTLPKGTRIVANAVTLETECLLMNWHAAKGGHLLRAELSETAPLGRMRGWNAARPILQWSVTR